ncbi:hypothetical protein BDQ17DRAFT_895510 [Cyathus striatus]|nr:hypothetical protein BDQ17DRAFT_895510 [Cyathus striatus]
MIGRLMLKWKLGRGMINDHSDGNEGRERKRKMILSSTSFSLSLSSFPSRPLSSFSSSFLQTCSFHPLYPSLSFVTCSESSINTRVHHFLSQDRLSPFKNGTSHPSTDPSTANHGARLYHPLQQPRTINHIPYGPLLSFPACTCAVVLRDAGIDPLK